MTMNIPSQLFAGKPNKNLNQSCIGLERKVFPFQLVRTAPSEIDFIQLFKV